MSENKWGNDADFQDSIIRSVDDGDSEHGWSITKEDGWSFFIPPTSPIEPTVGTSIRMYGKGIGYVVRGLFLDGHEVFYRTEEEEKEHFANEMYGKDAAELLQRWDDGRGVWSVSYGGLGPGYEQAIQVAAFEVLRHLLNGGKVESADIVLPKLSSLGLSGAQWGGARHLARSFYDKGPRGVHEMYNSERHIQVCKDFPDLSHASLVEENKRMREALEASYVALNDWLNVYAPDMCDPVRVLEAQTRIGDGGTIAYVALVTKQIRAALGDTNA